MHITCAKPGRGVSCLSRRPGMSLCLGTKHKCLWDIGQGGVTGLGPSHQPCIFEKIHVYACQSRWYLLGLLKDVRERGGQPSLLSEELERSVQTIITAGVLSLDIFFTSVLSWALIPELSRAQMSGLCNHQQSGLFCFLELLELTPCGGNRQPPRRSQTQRLSMLVQERQLESRTGCWARWLPS